MQNLRRSEEVLQRRWSSAVLALSLFAFCGVPLANLAQNVDETSPLPPPPALPGPIRYPEPDVRRDPFVPSEPEVEPGAAWRDDGGGIVLPPNAGAAQTSAGALLVRGVVLGPHPSALVQIGGRSFVVKAGSPLLGSSVRSIVKTGLVLQDGEELRFPERQP
jgi:hypothetical protein